MNLADELLRHMQKPKRSHHKLRAPSPALLLIANKRLELANLALVAARDRLARARRVVEVEAAKERDARRKVERAQKALAEAHKLAARESRIRRPLGD